MTETTPEQDFRRFREHGDAAALGRVFDALAGQLLLVAAHLAGDVAEDLVQATFLDAIEGRQRWDGSRPLAPWLCGILSMHVRRERQRRGRRIDARRVTVAEVPTPFDAAEAAEQVEAVRAAVAQLPIEYHQVLSLRFVHGLELQHIAHSLRLPLGTVKTRLYRGMAKLKRALPAGLATAFAAVALPGRGLSAMRAVVLGHAGAAVGAAAATVGAAAVAATLTPGLAIGAMAMQKLMIGVAAVVVLVGGWWAMSGRDAEPPTVAMPTAKASPAAVAADPSVVPPARTELSLPLPASTSAAPKDGREAEPAADSILVLATDATTGAPVLHFGLRASQPPRTAPVSQPLLHDGEHPGGRLLVPESELARGPYLLEDSRVPCVYQPSRWFTREGAVMRDGRRTIDVSLPRPVLVDLVIVRRRGGAPVADCKVELLRPWSACPDVTLRTDAQPPASFWVDPRQTAVMLQREGGKALWLGAATTDAEGRARLVVPPDEDLALRLPGPGLRPQVLQPWRVAASAAPQRIVLEVASGGAIQGRVLPASTLAQLRAETGGAGTPPAKAIATGLRLRHEATGEWLPVSWDTTLALNADGTFAVDGLQPGDWRLFLRYPLRLRDSLVSPQGKRLPDSCPPVIPIDVELPQLCDLQDGELRVFDIDISGWLPGRLEATVACDGHNLEDGFLVIAALDATTAAAVTLPASPNLRLDAMGRAAVYLPPARYLAIWRPIDGSLEVPLQEFAIDSESTARVDFAVNTFAAAVRVVEADGTTPAAGMVQVRLAHCRDEWSAMATADRGGCCAFPRLPVDVPLVATFHRPLSMAQQQEAAARGRPDEFGPPIALGALPAADSQGAILLRLPSH